jgi:hypothetical protein
MYVKDCNCGTGALFFIKISGRIPYVSKTHEKSAILCTLIHFFTKSQRALPIVCPCPILSTRGSRFLSYNFLQSAIDGKNNSKTKVEKAFFFIFMSSYAEMRF